jgi:NAD(P)-dependent dehydrogenase (short-subunit alcohol dehydrogenase family)
MRDLKDRVAVVTGAASGIGRAMAERFAAEGMMVVLSDVEEKSLAAATEAIKAKGAKALAVRTDVSKPAEVDALARKTLDAFGAVHVVCNNAGVASAGNSWEVTLDDWQWVLGVNLWGVIYGVKTFVPIMLSQGSEGHIVNTASMAGLVSGPGMASYNVAKFGVVTLSETLHHELAAIASKVKVSVLCPGWVNTRIADAERNRPANLAKAATPTPQQEMVMGMVRQFLESGLSPDRVAELVVEAIRAERLYILTHPEWAPMIRTRMEAIVAQTNPSFAGFTE